MKKCKACHKEKKLVYFHKDMSRKDFKSAYCTECKSEKNLSGRQSIEGLISSHRKLDEQGIQTPDYAKHIKELKLDNQNKTFLHSKTIGDWDEMTNQEKTPYYA